MKANTRSGVPTFSLEVDSLFQVFWFFCDTFFSFSSDGAGRSGVYLAIDANIELSEEDGVFDVFGYLKKMRQQRRGLIESLVRTKNENNEKVSP